MGADACVTCRVASHADIWMRYDRMEARLTAPLTRRMLELARLEPGMRALDLATGRGEPAIPAAHLVGPEGHVLGVDVSPEMLAMARARADEEGLTNLELRVADAALLDDVAWGSYAAVLVRWGLMYMDGPVAALTRARRALLPGGRLVAALWAEPERVPYYDLPRRLLAHYRDVPPPADAPGTFYYASLERILRDVQVAGFQVEHVEELETPVMEAATAAELVAWTRAFGMTRLLEGLPEEVQRRWEADLAHVGEGLRENGVIRLGGVTRIVVAR